MAVTTAPVVSIGGDTRRREPSANPFDRVLDALRGHGCKVRLRSASQARSTCPAHHDRDPSRVVTWQDEKVKMKCFAGCKTATVLAAIGLRLADLFPGPASASKPKRIVAVYSYCDMDGVIYAEKVRLEPKAFRWRVPAPETREGYRWGLNGASVGLYRLPALARNAGTVIVTEGERAADKIASVGMGTLTTCPPNGANSWDDAWSADLWALGIRRVVVLADNDQPGRRHAERVAASWATLTQAAGLTWRGRVREGCPREPQRLPRWH